MMTDYLTNLVDRALERVPVLERRRPARFEPVRSRAWPGGAVWAEEPTFEGAVQRYEVAPEAQESRTPQPHLKSSAAKFSELPVDSKRERRDALAFDAEAPLSLGPGARRATKPAEAVTPDTQRRSASVEPIDPLHRADRTPVPNSVEPPRITPNPLKTRRMPSEAEDVTGLEPLARPRRSARSVVENPEAARPAGSSRGTPTLPSESTLVRKPTVAASRSESVLPPSPKLARRQAPRIPEMKPVQTTVQVSIGRIEVRATTPMAAPHRSAQRETRKLKLEDYLKSRSGGGS
jgi:hypothetical protein